MYTTKAVQKNIQETAKFLTDLSGKGGDPTFRKVLEIFENEKKRVEPFKDDDKQENKGPFGTKFMPNGEQIFAIQEIL